MSTNPIPDTSTVSNPTPDTTSNPTPDINYSFDKSGLGLNLNSVSIVMAVLVPLLYLSLVIYKKSITLQFFRLNITAIIFFIFNLIIFIISLKTISKIKNGYNCKINQNQTTLIIEPNLKISDLGLTDPTIISNLDLNNESIICSNTLNYDNFNNIKSTGGYHEFLIFTIILQVIQVIFLLYYGFNSESLKDNIKYYIIFYILLTFNVCALFISLVTNMIGNKVAFVSDIPITSFKTAISKNSKLMPIKQLTPSQNTELQTSLNNKGVNDNYLICNSNGILNQFKYKDLNNSFTGFLLVVLITTLIMFFFLTTIIFGFNLSKGGRIIQWLVLSFTVGLVSGFTSFIITLDMKYPYSEIVSVAVGFASAGLPILTKIFLSIVNKS